MRKYLLLICCTHSLVVCGQAFQSKDLVVSFAYGFYRGDFTTSDTAGYSQRWGLFGSQIPLRIEYSFADHLSANFSYTYTSWGDRFFSRFEKHNIIEVGPGLSYHLPWDAKRIDFAGEVEGGLMWYNFRDYDTSNFSSEANGIFIRAGISPRIYFTKTYRLGALVYYRFIFNFLRGEENDHLNPKFEYSMKGYSHTYGVGLFYRFGSLRPSAYIDNTKPN